MSLFKLCTVVMSETGDTIVGVSRSLGLIIVDLFVSVNVSLCHFLSCLAKIRDAYQVMHCERKTFLSVVGKNP